MSVSDTNEAIFRSMRVNKRRGMFLHLDDEVATGRTIWVEGTELLSFGSCSYLGLETDPRLKAGAIRAAERYGTQYSSSRAYASSPLYAPLEEGFSEMFGGHAMLSPTTTLGHLSTLPVLMEEHDAIVVDHQAHHSLHLGVTQARAGGAEVQVVRHGALDRMEQAIQQFVDAGKEKVWLVLDGVYSMFGDLPDAHHALTMLNRYPNLHLYVDDAHGTSIAGKHGRGVHLSRMGAHPRMVIAASLAKAFGAGGGVIVFPTEELAERVRMCGGPMLFSGPIQPPVLGALHASLGIHLSDELPGLQAELLARITLLNELLVDRGLPLLARNDTPIFFIQAGLSELASRVVERMREHEDIFVNVSLFPAVPSKRAGVRIAVNRRHTPEDLERLADALARQYPLAMAEVGFGPDEVARCFASFKGLEQGQRQQVDRLFGVEARRPGRGGAQEVEDLAADSGLRLEHHRSIRDLDEAEWDRLLGDQGSIASSALRLLEDVFAQTLDSAPERAPERAPEHRWDFHYLLVRDATGHPVLATFFTGALWKDDMLMSAEVSRRVEERRLDDPYWMSSRCLAMGCLLTEGDHLYIDRAHPQWRGALRTLLKEVGRLQEELGASAVILRDLDAEDEELELALMPQGYHRVPMPDGHAVPLAGQDQEAWFASLGRSSRRFVRQSMMEKQDQWELRLHTAQSPSLSASQVTELHQLYLNVASKKLRLNVYPLPEAVIAAAQGAPGWEILSLHPRVDGEVSEEPAAFGVCHHTPEAYTAVYCGIDYTLRGEGAYRQLLWQVLSRARDLGCARLDLGMDAEMEKRRLGAEARKQCVYLLTTDHFNATTLEQVARDAALSRGG